MKTMKLNKKKGGHFLNITLSPLFEGKLFNLLPASEYQRTCFLFDPLVITSQFPAASNAKKKVYK